MSNNTATALVKHRRLVWMMAMRDLRAKYAGSLMGLFWTVINPLLLLAVFTFIFAVVFKARFGDRAGLGVSALYILCGILPWLAFADGVVRAGAVMLENKNLATRSMFPLPALPAFPPLSSLLGQSAGFVALVVISMFTAAKPAPPLLLLPALLALQLLFAMGLALLTAALSVYLRDIIHVLPVLMLVWMYATPVFYPAAMVPTEFQILMKINPMARLIESYRKIILEAAWPEPASIMVFAGFAAAALAAGALVFSRLEGGMADRL